MTSIVKNGILSSAFLNLESPSKFVSPIVDRLISHKHHAEMLLDFIREMTHIHEVFGKSLFKLLGRIQCDDTDADALGIYHTPLLSLCSLIELLAQSACNLGPAISSTCDKLKMTAAMDGFKSIRKLESRAIKCAKNFEQATSNLTAAKSATKPLPQKKLDQLHEKIKKEQINWTNECTLTSDTIQELETTVAQATAEAYLGYLSAQQNEYPKMVEYTQKLSQEIEGISPTAAICAMEVLLAGNCVPAPLRSPKRPWSSRSPTIRTTASSSPDSATAPSIEESSTKQTGFAVDSDGFQIRPNDADQLPKDLTHSQSNNSDELLTNPMGKLKLQIQCQPLAPALPPRNLQNSTLTASEICKVHSDPPKIVDEFKVVFDQETVCSNPDETFENSSLANSPTIHQIMSDSSSKKMSTYQNDKSFVIETGSMGYNFELNQDLVCSPKLHILIQEQVKILCLDQNIIKSMVGGQIKLHQNPSSNGSVQILNPFGLELVDKHRTIVKNSYIDLRFTHEDIQHSVLMHYQGSLEQFTFDTLPVNVRLSSNGCYATSAGIFVTLNWEKHEDVIVNSILLTVPEQNFASSVLIENPQGASIDAESQSLIWQNPQPGVPLSIHYKNDINSLVVPNAMYDDCLHIHVSVSFSSRSLISGIQIPGAYVESQSVSKVCVFQLSVNKLYSV